MRLFKASESVYEAVCNQMNASYGYPNAETATLRALPLVGTLTRDSAGDVYAAISEEYCSHPIPNQLIQELTEIGLIQEVSADEYAATLKNP